jgi:phospholipase C
MSPLTRRQLLVGGAAAATGAVVGRSAVAATRTARPPATLPYPASSGIDHIVVVVMENRSFDHYLGWLPGATGMQAGLQYADDSGVLHSTQHWPERHGCGYNDPDHSYSGGRIQLNGGLCDGFRRGHNDDFALGYYTGEDLPFYRPFVGQATVFDHWFCSILSQTYPNRYYTHAGRTEQVDNSMITNNMPTIWDRLSAAGVPATYYFNDLPFLALWGEKYIPIARSFETFLAQAASGTLPSFSYIDPFFLGEDQGGSNDDHPHADIHRGQAFLSLIANALVNSPLWSKTALIITYDEWGGFFDHVAPPKLPDDAPTNDFDHSQAGFRVPSFMFSPFARRGGIDSAVYDHTSILKFVEWRWGLAPLAPRDSAARNLAYALDFSKPDVSAPSIPLVTDPGPHLCAAPDLGMALEESQWLPLRDYVARSGWRHVL